jgi:hypothetical protein
MLILRTLCDINNYVGSFSSKQTAFITLLLRVQILRTYQNPRFPLSFAHSNPIESYLDDKFLEK